ncbi:MAG TPA: DoxX family membrane protein [Candidatus Tyrphobacter sp.]|nr:DoxX family membrane protein [Candidatus Tyrphobacter sp.]
MTKNQKLYLLILRLAVGWELLYAGITKIFTSGWSASGLLETAKTFPAFYQALNQPALIGPVNLLNEWGLTLIGLVLILGLWTRLASVLGIILMTLYYFADNQFPLVANGFVVDQHVILIISFLILIAFQAGRFWGLDGRRNKTD